MTPCIEIAFGAPPGQPDAVNKLCILVGTTVVGYAGGFLCSGLGLMAEIIGSGIGSIIGVYLGWKLAQRIDR